MPECARYSQIGQYLCYIRIFYRKKPAISAIFGHFNLIFDAIKSIVTVDTVTVLFSRKGPRRFDFVLECSTSLSHIYWQEPCPLYESSYIKIYNSDIRLVYQWSGVTTITISLLPLHYFIHRAGKSVDLFNHAEVRAQKKVSFKDSQVYYL